MNKQEILGMYSANAAAEEMPYGSNMTISAALVIEMVKRIVELEDLLKKFRPRDEDGDGWDFIYDEGSEYLGEAVLKALKESKP
jgi:hypothetical protein